MATAVATAPGYATLTPAIGGAVLVSVVGKATLGPPTINRATITTTTTPAVIAITGSAVVGSAVAGGPPSSSQDVGTSFVDFATVA